MDNKSHSFIVRGNFYKLTVGLDMFGCETMHVVENGVYRGCLDCFTEEDFKKIESYIRKDKEFVDTECWC